MQLALERLGSHAELEQGRVGPQEQYFAAEGNGGSTVKATVTAIGPWETFRMWKVGGSGSTIDNGDTFALQSGNGYYVVAEGNGGGEVNCNRTAIGSWETFTLVK